MIHRRILPACLLVAVALSALSFDGSGVYAADHGDAPNVAHDQGADVGDGFLFRDPNDNSRIFLGYTVRGFIVPGEAVNFAFFDPNIRYRFEIENTGDETADRFIDVRFTDRVSNTEPQTATISFSGRGVRKRSFTAPTTIPNLSPTPAEPTVTTDAESGAQFFAGPVDDPFVFDIPGFARFVGSVRAGSPNPALLQRGRDTFAGYNIMAIAIEVPLTALRDGDEEDDDGNPVNEIGLAISADRRSQTPSKTGLPKSKGSFRTIDRTGNPALNAVFIPTERDNLVNGSTQRDYARGRFDADVIATATALGTNEANQQALLNVYLRRGDYLRLNLGVQNLRTDRDNNVQPRQTSEGDGDNPEAAFPNGRRLSDDVVDTLLRIVANGADLSDNANTLDVPLRSQFPFFGPPHQPRNPDPAIPGGNVDDATRN